MALFKHKDKDSLLEETDAERKISIRVQNFHDPVYSRDVESEGKTAVLNHEHKNRAIYLQESNSARNGVTSQNLTQVIENIKQYVNHDISIPNTEIASLKEDISLAESQHRYFQQDWQNFRYKHNLGRFAHFPDNHIKSTVVLVISLLLVEVLSNSIFFSIASEYGLAGGILTAFILSVVNILVSLVASYSIRYLNHVKIYAKAIGYILTIIFSVCAASLALFVGHYRSALEENPESAHIDAVQSFIDTPFAIGTVSSWILASISFLVFIITLYKFFKSDDPYPGFGEITRKKDVMRDNLIDARAHANEKLDKIGEELLGAFQKEIDLAGKAILQITDAKNKLDLLFYEFDSFLKLQKNEYENFCFATRNLFSAQTMQGFNQKAQFPEEIEEIILSSTEHDKIAIQEAHQDYASIKIEYEGFIHEELPDLRERFVKKVNDIIKTLREQFNEQA